MNATGTKNRGNFIITDEQKREALWEVFSTFPQTMRVPMSTIVKWMRVGEKSYARWRKEQKISLRHETKIGHLTATSLDLQTLFSNPENRRIWLTTQNPYIPGVPADLMRTQEGLIDVRIFLEDTIARGG